MKKVIISSLLSVLLVGSYSISNISAETQNQITYKAKDNVMVTEYLDTGDFAVVVPSEIVEKNLGTYGFSDINAYEEGKTRSGVWAVIAVTLGACQIINYATDFDPCDAAVKYLMNGNKPSGKYKVTRQWIAGHVPGCEPEHSGTCNSGYYKYNFQKIG